MGPAIRLAAAAALVAGLQPFPAFAASPASVKAEGSMLKMAAVSGVASATPSKPNGKASRTCMLIVIAGGSDTMRRSISGCST